MENAVKNGLVANKCFIPSICTKINIKYKLKTVKIIIIFLSTQFKINKIKIMKCKF